MPSLFDEDKTYVLDRAKVIEVNGNKVHVRSLTTGKDYFKTSVGAVMETEEQHLSVYPAEKSVVVIGIYEKHNSAVILQVSKVSSIYFKIDNTEFKANQNGFEIQRDGKNLKDVLNDFQKGFGKLCDELSKVVVSVGVTPNVPVITEIKQSIVQTNQSDLNSILI